MSDTQSEKYFNIELAALDADDDNNITDTNVGSTKISIILVPRWGDEFSKKESCIFLKYNQDVPSFYIEDDLNSIGVNGYIDVINMTSHLDLFLGKLEDYFVVINLTEYTVKDGNPVPVFKYEPYVFVATSVDTLTPIDSENKVLRIKLESYITNILKTHAFGDLLIKKPQILKCLNYKDFFVQVLDYCKDFIKINMRDSYSYLKEVLYTSDMTLGGGIYNGNDGGNDLSKLLINSAQKIKPDDSIYQAMVQMMKDCCTTLKTPASFSNNNQIIGDVLIPFFFKEEYGDVWGLYHDIWGGTGSVATSTAAIQNGGGRMLNDSVLVLNKDQKCPLILRNITMRDIYMPCHVSFSVQNQCCIYETINPDTPENEKNFIPLNGTYNYEIAGIQYIPISTPLLKKLKKNILFLDGNQGGGAGCSAALVFYSWIFDYYQNVFLKTDLTKSNKDISEYRIPNFAPSFLITSRQYGINHAKSGGNAFENKFDEINSYIICTETEDSLNECLRVVGKNIAAFLLGNEAYNFRIRGNLLRRPNEILKFGYRGNSGETQQSLTMNTSIALSGFTFLYVKKVGHLFRGKEYWNDIVGCKIAEIIPNK